MDHRTLIAKLGGPHALRERLVERGLSVTQVAVRAWALDSHPPRFIPAKYWTHIIAIARSQGIPVTVEDLAQSVSARPKATRKPRETAVAA